MKEVVFDKPLKRSEVEHILRNESLRMDFVNEYPYFMVDENRSLYESFIEKSFINYRKLEDAIEIASYINYFDKKFIDVFYKKIKIGNDSSLILTILDYLFRQKKYFNLDTYIELNYLSLLKGLENRQEIILFQALLNLLIIGDKFEVIEKIIFKLLAETKDVALFYRFSNFPPLKSNSYLLSQVFIELENHQFINPDQKREIKQNILKSEGQSQ